MKPPRQPPVSTTPPRHRIDDHRLGADWAHVHAPGEDHDHDHDGMDLLPAGVSDDVVLISIGIDVGSSGTQVAFARLTLEQHEPFRSATLDAPTESETQSNADAGALLDGSPDGTVDRAATRSAAPRMPPRRRETIYRSPVVLTPFTDATLIDAEALDHFVSQSFDAAALTPDDIDCGVVILTGAARDRDNAEAITRRLADRCGDIVSASAGHHMEARIAAHGSRTVERSAVFGQRLLNLDIGGATTKLAVCDHGRVIATAALDIGGRLVATDAADRIVRLAPAGRRYAAGAGFDWQVGGLAPWSQRKTVGLAMAGALVTALALPQSEEAGRLSLTGPLPVLDGVGGVVVSGGVGEYVYGRETRSFGDLGLALGRALAARIDEGALPFPLMPAGECIRATVLGASAYAVQLSGRTGFISAPAVLLPRRNLPVVSPTIAWPENPSDAPDPAEISAGIRAALTARDLDGPGAAAGGDVVLALDWKGHPDHARLVACAEGVKRGFMERLHAGHPLYVLVEADVAASLGAILRDELGLENPALVLDGVALSGLDYVDLGRIRLPSGTVPLTIKSLVFGAEPGQKANRSLTRRSR